MNIRSDVSFYGFLGVIILVFTGGLTAQDSLDYKTIFPSGISVGYGQGLYSVKDEYVSREKYSGTISSINIEWMRFRNKSGYRFQLYQQNSIAVENNSINLEMQQFVFNQDFFYPIGYFSLFSKNVYAFLGPTVQFFYYDLRNNFVTPGTFISPNTKGYIGSLGFNTEFIYPLNSKLNIEALIRSNLISVASKSYDETRFEDEPGPLLMTVITASKIDFDLSVRYYIVNKISFSLAYKFDFAQINKWDPYIAASDNVSISFNYRF